jgi:hypothetical protein
LQIDPGLAPCLSGRHASFTGVPVFPHYPYLQYLSDIGHKTGGYGNSYGTELRYTYEANNLRGQLLTLHATLVMVDRGGDLTATGLDPLVFAAGSKHVRTFTPDKCSQVAGGIFWVHPRQLQPARYEIVLELFAGKDRIDRLALGVSPVFRG